METMTRAQIRDAKDALFLLSCGNYQTGAGKDFVIRDLLLMIRYLADRVDTLESAVENLEEND